MNKLLKVDRTSKPLVREMLNKDIFQNEIIDPTVKLKYIQDLVGPSESKPLAVAEAEELHRE